jgi:C4-dicarboxylate transporter
MTAIMAKLLTFLPMVTAFAEGAPATNGTMTTIIRWVGGIGCGIVALMLIISLIKDGIGIAKGSGDSSILKIAGKILFLIVIIGLIGIAMAYNDIAGIGANAGGKALNVVNTEMQNLPG